MIYSMTGYAVVGAELPFGALNLELRSVNNRYLDIQFRIPDELRPLESGLRERASARINRGKVEVRIAIAKSAASQSNSQLPCCASFVMSTRTGPGRPPRATANASRIAGATSSGEVTR